MCETKKKLQRAEDFVGWISPDGLLEVVELVEKSKHSKFKVICKICSQDPELFPEGYFISQKTNLMSGHKPCGCSNVPKWKPFQFLVLANRAAQGRFIVHGFAEEFHGQKTKLDLECIKDGHRWKTSVNDIINQGTGCPKCYGNIKYTEEEALSKCRTICVEMNYEVVGFPEGYNGSNKTRFEYKCPKHGLQKVTYDKFTNEGTRCPVCAKELGNGNGYYPERKDEQDFLYVLNFNDEFIKVGRSFNIDDRIGNLRTASKIKLENIYKLRIFTATHQEIYDYEQELLEDLRERGFQHYLDWTNECFENDCIFVLNRNLDMCNIFEIEF